jgi:hypothetical protein
LILLARLTDEDVRILCNSRSTPTANGVTPDPKVGEVAVMSRPPFFGNLAKDCRSRLVAVSQLPVHPEGLLIPPMKLTNSPFFKPVWWPVGTRNVVV